MSKIYTDLLARAEPFPALKKLLLANGHVPLARRRSACLFDAMARTVVGQQLGNHAARAIWQKLWEKSAGQPYKVCRSSSAARLKSSGLSAAKIKALRELATAFSKGAIREEDMQQMDHARRSEIITSLWGFGQWSADMIAIFYFRDPDIWSPGDLALRRAMDTVSNGSSRREQAILKAFATKKSYLCLQLWRSLSSKKQ